MCEEYVEEYTMPSGNIYNHIKGNALDWAEKDGYCMVHVCNNKGGFGGGKTALAAQVKERFPDVYDRYTKFYHHGGISCGKFDSVANLIAQDGYGARWKGIKYFKEDWFEMALEDFLYNYKDQEQCDDAVTVNTIVVPYKMGSDRANGDWNWIIEKTKEILGEHFNILVVEI